MSSDSSSDFNYDENEYGEEEEEDIVEDDMVQMQLQFILLETSQDKINSNKVNRNASATIATLPQINPNHQPSTNTRLKSIKINNSVVNLEIGDLTLSHAQVIVNTTKPTLDLECGLLSKLILAKAGSDIQTECKKNYPDGIETNQVAITSSGQLRNFKNIFHVTCEKYAFDEESSGHLLRKIVSNCLEKLRALNMTSIAFPAIGTGSLKFPNSLVARCYLDVVSSFIRQQSSSIGLNVIFVVYENDSNLRQAFEFEFDIYSRINAVPNYWSKFPSGFGFDSDFLLVDVDLRSNEGKSVFEDFKEKFHDDVQIKSLQNTRLFRAYLRFRETLDKRKLNEKYLFHGTSEENIESICKYGFKKDLCGKNGFVLGQGVYFALYSRYSDKFNEILASSPGDTFINKKRMFKVRVTLGDSCLGDPSYKKAPNGFQSCMDVTQTLYACYDDSQFYPEYILTYFT